MTALAGLVVWFSVPVYVYAVPLPIDATVLGHRWMGRHLVAHQKQYLCLSTRGGPTHLITAADPQFFKGVMTWSPLFSEFPSARPS